MLRPSDPAPGPARIAAAATPSASTTPPRIVVVHAPRPLYECVTDDGARYPSDTREGNPRWVPLAIFGYPAYPRYDQSHRPGNDTGGRWQYRSGPLGRVDFGRPLRPAWTAHVPRPYPLLAGVDRGIPAGTWIRDTCHALPQQDVCDRLRDRRYQLDRRYHSALQSERAQISTEQRGIDARLSNDCGMY